MAGKTSRSVPRLNHARIQTSTYSAAITKGWGTFRCSLNLIYMGPLHSKTDKAASGKGGLGGAKTYDYWADVLLAACEGGLLGIAACKEVFKDSSHFVDGDLYTHYSTIASALTALGNTAMAADYTVLANLAQAINTGSTTALQSAGLSMANGALGQAPQSWLTGTNAIGYSQTCYFWAQNYSLSTSATLSNHTMTLMSQTRVQVGSVTLDDGEPSVIIADTLQNPYDGVPGWPQGVLGDWTEYQTANMAYSFFISPSLDSQTSAASAIQEMLDASNAAGFWSEGVLKIRPYADTAKTANGVTFTPNLTPIYSLSEVDYIVSGNEDPIEVILKEPKKAFNQVQVEFEDRTHQYNTQTIPANDQASIDQYGPRKENPVNYRCIKMPSVATAIAQVRVQRTANVWRTFKFKLGQEFAALEPMDLVELNCVRPAMTNKLVRITSIDEGADDIFTVEAEEMLVGASSAPLVSRQGVAAVLTNYDVAPGNVSAPVLINPPRTITTAGGYELWVGASGGASWGGCEVWVSLDGTNYAKQGEIDGPSTYGVLTAALAVGTDPDTTNTLAVDLSQSTGSLSSTSTTTADAGGTLCIVNGELISYATATLTGANAYNVTYLRRGRYGTAIASHASGAEFVVLDGTIFKYPYTSLQIGATIYVKFLSFNLFGRARQALSDVSAYTVTLTPTGEATLDVIASVNIAGGSPTNTLGTLATQSSVTTGDIATGAVTQTFIVSGSTPITMNGTDVTVLTDTLTINQDCTIQATAVMKAAFSNGAESWSAHLYINGTDTFPTGGTNFADSLAMAGAVTITGATYPLSVTVSATFNASSHVAVDARNLVVNILKR
jgi:hypothetical protein